MLWHSLSELSTLITLQGAVCTPSVASGSLRFDVCASAESILDTICSVLEAESACVALTDFPEKVYFWSGRGICMPGTYAAWAKSFMAVSLTATNNTVTIIEDTAEDARSVSGGGRHANALEQLSKAHTCRH